MNTKTLLLTILSFGLFSFTTTPETEPLSGLDEVDSGYFYVFCDHCGDYSGVVWCGSGSHIKVPNSHHDDHHDFRYSGPYHTHDEAEHARDRKIHHYNEENHNHAEYRKGIFCDEHH